MITEEKKCSRCILDSNLPGIEFDEKGECNYCKLFEDLEKEYPLGKEGEKNLQALITKIKAAGEGQKYDCVVGVSGGTDSTYVLYEAVKLGLRPLAVHFDNGWNSEIAVNNIQQACQTLGVDLFTYVVDWEEFKNIQLSFLKSSNPDLEIPTDLGIVSIL